MSSRIVKFPNPAHLFLKDSQIKGAGKGKSKVPVKVYLQGRISKEMK